MSFELPAILSKANLELIGSERPLELTKHDTSPVSVEDVVYSLDNKEAQKALLRKLDIMSSSPCLPYFWCYIDRIDVGYANLQGIEKISVWPEMTSTFLC
jgi:hypothetical protein